MAQTMRQIANLMLALMLGLMPVTAQPAQPLRLLDPVAAIVEAFDTHDLVAIGDAHGKKQSLRCAWRWSVTRASRLASRTSSWSSETRGSSR